MKRRFDGSLPGDLLLQSGRHRPGHQIRWRMILRFQKDTAPRVQGGVQMLAGADAGTLWRVVAASAPMVEVARWDGSSWV